MKILKFLFHSLVGTANVIVMVLLILAAYSDWVAPSSSILFSYLGLGFAVIALLNLCFLFYWLIVGKWKMGLVVVASFLLCLGPLTSYFPLHCTKQKVPEEALKILTYNVMGFAYKDHTQTSPNEIVKYIADSNADIVCLQEYTVYPSEKLLTSKKLFNALKMYPYHKVMDRNIAVFSKYPITNSRQIKYESVANGSAIHEIDVNGKKLILINNHLESLKLTTEDKTKYKVFIKSLGADEFDGLKGTFQQKLGPAFRIRAKQAEILAQEIQAAGNNYVVVCGDFNDTPISYAHRVVQGPLIDAFSESGCGMGISYNQNLFFFRIDHILHSKNIKSFNCTVDRKIKASDHYPVWCYMSLD
ncbi:endonuclease/exonuclease/phosphatase family protein [Parabacteroides pacaensis]|uniref:endonuclease/exonuclease/phosphatase family protein n=1 Tax=Parabacteroides pacaensis TaxID=2086575 RepID=UPI000D0E5AFA|nr:endonuclease/exonuclease/phosphatase family protein [Parabacteroides pacaensis]